MNPSSPSRLCYLHCQSEILSDSKVPDIVTSTFVCEFINIKVIEEITRYKLS